MRVIRSTLSVALLAIVAGAFAPLQAQTGSVTGTVRNADTGQPLTGVQMVVVGSNAGALTNAEGRYLITNVATGERTIRAVLIGFSQGTQTVTVSEGAPAVADFSLSTSAVNIDAISVNVVTGREQRARELGSNVAQLEVENINPGKITSVADILSGRAAGVTLQDVNGNLGSSQRIRIRGANSLSLSNEPLVFVDGVPISTSQNAIGLGGQEPSRLNDINPQDIADIEIVKGPAATGLYGTAAANGVILITTKRGAVGEAQWDFFAEVGEMSDETDYPTNWASLAVTDPNGDTFTSSGAVNTGARSFCSNRAAAAGVCTQDETITFNTTTNPLTTFFQTGSRQRYGAAVRGGTEQTRYYVSGSFEDDAGVIPFNTSKATNLRANLDAQLGEQTDLTVSIGYTDSDVVFANGDNSIFSPQINGILGYPNYLTNSDGSRSRSNYGFFLTPDGLAEVQTTQAVDRLTTSGSLNFRPTPWLTVSATGGVDFTSQFDFETVQPGGEVGLFGSPLREGYRDSQRSQFFVYTGRATGSASFDLTPEITSTTTAGFSYDQSTRRETSCFGANLVAGTSSCETVSTQFDIGEQFFEVRTVGTFVQQDFGWRDRVFVSASLRGDDNSAFGQDFGLAYFPSLSASWVIAEEEWFPQTDAVSDLRLRGAWGQSGLRPGFRDAPTLFTPVTVALPGGDNDSGIILDNQGNSELEPETATEIEFGFDAGLFSDRLSVGFTYFDKTSEDALIARPVPGSIGLATSVFQNLGEINNSGTELELNLDVYQSDMFGLNVGFTNATLSNEVVELGEGIDPIIFNRGLQRHENGFSAGGFWQTPYTYDDADGDGKLSISDLTLGDESEFIGPSLPEWNRTVFADLRISDWITVSTLFEGRGGHYTGNDTEAFRCGRNSVRGCAAVGDPNATLDEQAAYIADRFLGTAYGYVEEADFWRWRELSVAFDMPSFVTESASQLEGLRLTLSGRNLATFTDYTGLDPETVEGGGSANFSNSEFNTQPPVRLLTLRLDYRF